MLNQRLQQKLLQKLSPQQILLMKLLQIPSMALEQRIKQEIEENPALELPDEATDNQDEENYDDVDDSPVGSDDEPETDEFMSSRRMNSISMIIDEDEIPLTGWKSSNPDDDQRDAFAAGTSFHNTSFRSLARGSYGAVPDRPDDHHNLMIRAILAIRCYDG
jgi:RNA polymerase sigma-54 factor